MNDSADSIGNVSNQNGDNRVRTNSESSTQSFQTSASTVSSVSQDSQVYASNEQLPGARGHSSQMVLSPPAWDAMQVRLNADSFSQPVGMVNEKAQPLMMNLNELINHQQQQNAYLPANGNYVNNQQAPTPMDHYERLNTP